MKKSLFTFALVVSVSCSLLFSSCNKDADAQPDQTAVQDNNAGINESEDLVSISDEVFTQNSSNLRQSAEGTTYYGATVTITPKGSNEKGRVVIDFGSAGTKGRDNRTRTGKIIIDYTNRLPVSGATRIFSFDNYHVGGNHIEGTKSVTFSTEPTNGIYTAEIISALTITTEAGEIIKWNSTRARTYNTKNTTTLTDDEVSFTGTAVGVTRNDVSYTATISTPIVIKAECLTTSGWVPSSGVLSIVTTNAQLRTVNYGSGTCDRTVSVSNGTRSFDVTIR